MQSKSAHDIADGTEVSRDHLNTREYHHLFPVAHLKDAGISEGMVYKALNCALITWKTNRTLSAKEPLLYLRERCEASTLGETEIRNRLKTHAISYDILAKGDYNVFLEERAMLFLPAIQELCDGIDWKP